MASVGCGEEKKNNTISTSTCVIMELGKFLSPTRLLLYRCDIMPLECSHGREEMTNAHKVMAGGRCLLIRKGGELINRDSEQMHTCRLKSIAFDRLSEEVNC